MLKLSAVCLAVAALTGAPASAAPGTPAAQSQAALAASIDAR
ncbi:hypothetical protein [Massilia sp. Dwa41.01b]|nr:hypothetical protein [Massilia sp. Dwa41.01b]